MPTRDGTLVGAPAWIELDTTDVDRARAFYGRLFGWESEEPDPAMGGYFNFVRDGSRIAGGMASQPGVGDVWALYLASDDARKTVELAASHGAEVIVPAMDVAELGTMAVLRDPTGAAVGVWQPGTHPGFTTVGEPGAPSWFELHTAAFGPALDFYRDVFRLEAQTVADTDEFRYSVLSASGEQVAGVADDSAHLAPGASYWKVYFWTEDADATAAKVTELGGRVLRPPADTPWGRLVEVADPLGNVFMLQAANEAMPAGT